MGTQRDVSLVLYLDTEDRRKEMEELMQQNQQDMSQMEQSWQQKMEEREKEFKVGHSTPTVAKFSKRTSSFV